MFEAGASLLRVSRLMGHANVGITAAIYVHPDAAGDRDAIDLLTARMAGVQWLRGAESGRGSPAWQVRNLGQDA